jgi:hypothetical protein
MTIFRLFRRLLPSLAMLRLSVYLTLVAIVFCALATRSVRADVGELGMAAGRQLSRLEDLTEGAEVLVVNGARFHHSSVYTDEPVSTVLDRFQAECERDPGLLARALHAVPAEGSATLAKLPRASRNAVVRDESEAGGMLACFVGAKPATLAEAKERIAQLVKTRNLRELGDLRYTYAVPKGERTRVITLWTDSELDIARMFPARGDAAGSDSVLAPRPPASRRTLSATAADFPFGVRVYESERSQAQLETFYQRALEQRGFSKVSAAGEVHTDAFLRPDGVQVFVSLAVLDSKTYVTLTEAQGRVATVSVAAEAP